MNRQVKKAPLFWINPNFRLKSPHFRLSWFKTDINTLKQETLVNSQDRKAYMTNSQCVICVISPDHAKQILAPNKISDGIRLFNPLPSFGVGHEYVCEKWRCR